MDDRTRGARSNSWDWNHWNLSAREPFVFWSSSFGGHARVEQLRWESFAWRPGRPGRERKIYLLYSFPIRYTVPADSCDIDCDASYPLDKVLNLDSCRRIVDHVELNAWKIRHIWKVPRSVLFHHLNDSIEFTRHKRRFHNVYRRNDRGIPCMAHQWECDLKQNKATFDWRRSRGCYLM